MCFKLDTSVLDCNFAFSVFFANNYKLINYKYQMSKNLLRIAVMNWSNHKAVKRSTNELLYFLIIFIVLFWTIWYQHFLSLERKDILFDFFLISEFILLRNRESASKSWFFVMNFKFLMFSQINSFHFKPKLL